MDFSDALHCLQSGCRVSRVGWNGKGMWIEMQTPNENSKMTLPYIFMKTAGDNLVPWLCSQTDMLTADWGIVFNDEDIENG